MNTPLCHLSSCSPGLGADDESRGSQPQPQRPIWVLQHHPPFAAGSCCRHSELSSTDRHGASVRSQTPEQRQYDHFVCTFLSVCFSWTVPLKRLPFSGLSGCPREQKRVWFADGILPNGEVADTTKLSVTSRRSSQEFSGVSPDQTTVRQGHNTHTAEPQGHFSAVFRAFFRPQSSSPAA